jgi:hypothetical protein
MKTKKPIQILSKMSVRWTQSVVEKQFPEHKKSMHEIKTQFTLVNFH